MNQRFRVLVVDDSSFARSVISRELASDPEIEVIGSATDGLDGLEKTRRLKPSVVTLDVEMPRMDGLTTLRRIMSECPTPVVMLSSVTGEGTEATIRALELGAVDFVLKPSAANPAGPAGAASDLITKVKMAARISGPRLRIAARLRRVRPVKRAVRASSSEWNRVVVIGSSTGGPKTLFRVIPSLPSDIPAAILVVQHMPAGFTRSLAERLDQESQIKVKEAQPEDVVSPGQALVAPGDYHMTVATSGKIGLNQGPPVCGVRPSVDVTMESVARVYGASALGVVLTGMGSDGTRGAELIKAAGGKVAVQDEPTCVVYGMPKSVVDAGHVDKVVPLNRLAHEILRMCLEKQETSLRR